MDLNLYEAAMKGDIDVLVRYQDQFETQLTPKGNTILHIAAMHGKTQGVVDRRILRICRLSLLGGRVDWQSETPVDMILRICPFLLGRVNSQGETPLHVAARAGHAGIVQALFDFVDRQNNGIEIGRFSWEMLIGEKNVDGDTAFHMALRNGHLGVVKLLLEKNSTFLYQPNIKEETPLYLAGKNGFDGIVSEILIKTCTSSRPLYCGPDGRTALHAAIIFGSRECTAKLLIWRGHLAKEADVNGWTPLHHAAYLGNAQLVKILLDVDKSVAYLTSYENDGKNTALHTAARQGHVNVIKMLLSSCPPCWEIDNIKGQNILDIALENNKNNVVEYIKKNSSLKGLINQKANAGNTCDPQLLAAATDVPNTVNHLQTTKNQLLQTRIEALKKMADTHMIVAALIAAVTFTAGLTVPGGYYGNDGPNPGTAILSRSAAFKTFTFANTAALGLSVIAILFYFDAAAISNDKEAKLILIYFDSGISNDKEEEKLRKTYKIAGLLVAQALTTMMIGFVTGTYAVLANSLFLSVSNCVLGCIIVLINYLYYIRLFGKGLVGLLRHWYYLYNILGADRMHDGSVMFA